MTNGKIITGVAVGVLVALVLIPKSRKMITDALRSLTDSINGFANGAEDVADKAHDIASSVKSARQAVS
jgi:gas vesicle protein